MQSGTAIVNDPRWASVVARNAAADGSFFYSVKTTGVYCRPSCGARLPKSENVGFHLSCEDAEKAGFRPCKRCKPREAPPAEAAAAKIAAVCRLIEVSEQVPTLTQLAARAGMSQYHFHRVFKQSTGLTPRQYAAAHRDKRARAALMEQPTVTGAIYEAGYESTGPFYQTSNQVLGMTPSRYRAGGAGTEIRFAVGECSLGTILVAESDRGICAISIGDTADALVRDLEDSFPKANLVGGDARFEKLVAEVIGLVEAPGLGVNLPLDIRGTAFQRRVWEALRKIPAGTTATYSEVARDLGAPGSARAVARACAANVLAVAIPCHRVVRADGQPSGYRWGIERKQRLLQTESKPQSSDRSS